MASQTQAYQSSQYADEILQHNIDVVVNRHFTEGNPGVAVRVTQKGQVLYERSLGVTDLEDTLAITDTTNFRMASVSKHFTARAIYKLIEEGKLSFGTMISDLLPGLPNKAKSITVAHLLTHTSGIWDYEGLIPKDRQEQVSDWDVLSMLSNLSNENELYFEPGEEFRYSNTGFCLLSLIVEQVAGVPYADYMQQELFSPLGLKNTYLYEKGKEMPLRAFGLQPFGEYYRFADQSVTSATKGDGCVYISAQNFASWADQILNTKNSSDYLKQLQAMKYPVRDGIYYSLGWFVVPPGEGQGLRLFHSGETTGFRNIVFLDVEKQIIISVFSNQDDPTGVAEIFEEIRNALKIPFPILSKDGGMNARNLMDWLSETY